MHRQTNVELYDGIKRNKWTITFFRATKRRLFNEERGSNSCWFCERDKTRGSFCSSLDRTIGRRCEGRGRLGRPRRCNYVSHACTCQHSPSSHVHHLPFRFSPCVLYLRSISSAGSSDRSYTYSTLSLPGSEYRGNAFTQYRYFLPSPVQ